jgi:hypothetical protein
MVPTCPGPPTAQNQPEPGDHWWFCADKLNPFHVLMQEWKMMKMMEIIENDGNEQHSKNM